MIKSLFNKFVLWLADDHIRAARRLAYATHETRITQRREEIQKFEIENAMGKKIIYCSNEWTDPDFGTVVGVAPLSSHRLNSEPMLKCKNALFGVQGHNVEEFFYVMLRTYFMADELMTNAILKLNPFERWNLKTGKSVTTSNMWTKWYPEKKQLTHPTTLEYNLRKVGFMLPLPAGEKLISMGQLSSPRSVFDFFFVNKEEKIIRYRRKDDLATTRVKSIKLNTDEQLQEAITILGIQLNSKEQNG
jgi:hypothetical protein